MGQIERPTNRRPVERRRTPRYRVECWAEEYSEAGVYFHLITNLSRDGFFVEKKLPFRKGQTVHVRLDLPGIAPKLEAQSQVINNYHDGHDNLRGAGFRFLNLDERGRDLIEAFIHKTHSPNG